MDKFRELYSIEGDNSSRFEEKNSGVGTHYTLSISEVGVFRTSPGQLLSSKNIYMCQKSTLVLAFG